MASPRVLVGILCCGENEYAARLAALERQCYRACERFVIERLPNQRAAPLIDHSPDPPPLQAFQFGVHRAMKAFQPDRVEKQLGRALVHWRILTSVWSTYRAHGDVRRLYAVAGAEYVFKTSCRRFRADYKDRAMGEFFEQQVLARPAAALEGELGLEWDYPVLNDQRFVQRFMMTD